MSVLSAETTFLYVVCAMVVFAIAVPFVAAAPPPEPVDPTMTAGFDPGTAAAGVTAPDEEGTATIGDRSFDTAQAAIDAAEPGETIVLDGRFDERVTVEADAVKIIAGENGAVIDGGEQGRVLTVTGDRVAVEGVWITGSGYDVTTEDSGVYVDGNGTTLRSLRITDSAFGIWIDGVDDVTIADVRIEGRADVHPVTDRGNGIHLFGTNGTTVEDSEITDVRDGIYYSWASNVRASNNAMWNNRYGVHYMYSDDNQLVDNVAVDNGVGYALMVSERLVIRNNTAIRNADTSGHGILAKDIERSTIDGNVLVENANGLYVYNAQDNQITNNLVLRNAVGIHSTAGSEGQLVAANSFIDNDRAVETTRQTLAVWNGTDRGNYWSDARTADLDGDGVSESRHRPAGLVEHLIASHPQAEVFADSPAFEAVRLAESSFPVIESPGIVDRQPMVEPRHDWRIYAHQR